MNYICFYHSPCNDGELAKMIWKNKYPKSIFFPWIHSNEKENVKFLKKFKNEHIVFLDYCPKKEYLSNDNKYIIIDHHKNAIQSLTETDNIKMYCDIDRAGCMLTWDYIYPHSPYPLSIYHIGCSDIFDFSHMNTEPFSLSYKKWGLDYNKLISLKCTDEVYKDIVMDGVKTMAKLKLEAITIFYTCEYEQEKINNTTFDIIKVYCEKKLLFKYLIELAKINFKDYNILKIQINKGNRVTYSLRSLDGSPVDVLARKYGGNGHPMAAGYTIYYCE